MSSDLIDRHQRAILARLSNSESDLKSSYLESSSDSDGIEIIQPHSEELKKHCQLQNDFLCKVIKCKNFGKPNAQKPFENHYWYYDSGMEHTNFDHIRVAYKGIEFAKMNKNLYYRSSKNFYDRINETNRYSCQTSDLNGNSCQFLHNENYLFLQGILDLPKFNQEVILYRSISRTMGAEGKRDIYKYLENYKVGKVLPNHIFTSTGLFPSESETENTILLKIHLPANFPAMFWFADCGGDYHQTLEMTEVVLPYTTERSGRHLTWGFKVTKIEKNKKMQGINGDSWTIPALVTVDIVDLDSPIPLKTYSEYENVQGFNSSEMYDLYEKDMIKDKVEIFHNLVVEGIKNGKLKDQKYAYDVLKKLGFDETDLKMMEYAGVDSLHTMADIDDLFGGQFERYTSEDLEMFSKNVEKSLLFLGLCRVVSVYT